jgi:CubicO group peptidase (beta-lactamase class C family)
MLSEKWGLESVDVRIIGGMVLVCAIVVVVGVLFYDYDFNPGVTDDSGSTGNSTNAPGNTTTPINQLSSTLPAVNPSPSVGPSPNPNPGPSPTPTMDMAKVVQIMDQYLRSIFPQTHIPGLAIAIVQNGKVYYINTLGVKNVTTGEGVTPDTIFQIGSLSKAFTATYIAQLVDKGILHWNDKIKNEFPPGEFKLYGDLTDILTINYALSHSSGLPAYSGNTNWLLFNESYNSILYKFRNVYPDAPFPTYEYNNIIYCLPAFYAQKITGTTWDDAVKQNLLIPLGMYSAVTNTKDFYNALNHAASYKYTSTGKLVEWHPVYIDTVGPSGSMGASLNEMIHWLNFQIADTGYYDGVKIVSKKYLDTTKTPHITMDNTTQYGYGWLISDHGYIAHAGSTVSSESAICFYPSSGVGMVVLNNQNPLGLALNTALQIKLMDVLNGNYNTDPWPAQRDGNYVPASKPADYTKSPYPYNDYVGVYHNSFYGNIKITNNNSKLYCYYGTNSDPYALRHYNDTIFIDGVGGVAFGFTNITNGKAKQVQLTLRDYTAPLDYPSQFNRTNST